MSVSSPPRELPRPLAAGVLLAFGASLVAVLVTPWCTRDRVHDPQSFVAALRAAAALQPGDTVLIHPPWRHDVLEAVRASGLLPPGSRASTALARRHGDPWPPLVVVADAALPLPRALDHHLGQAGPASVHAGVRVVRSSGGAGTSESASGTDLTAELARAAVEVRTPGASGTVITPCPWDAVRQRHVCRGLPEWMTVGMDTLLIGGRRERCVWAHPITGGELSVAFPPRALRGRLALDLAFSDGAADNRTGARVDAEVKVNGRTLGRLARLPGARGFASSTLDLEAAVAGEAGEASEVGVEIVIRTPNDGQRHTCFRLSVRPAASSAGAAP